VALAFSQVAVAFGSFGFSSRENLEEQSRQLILVSRVPRAPFYTLVVLNMLFAFTGLVVGIQALYANAGYGVREVQQRLSIWGVVAHIFEQRNGGKVTGRGPTGTFEASKSKVGSEAAVNIGVERNRTGLDNWVFRIWSQLEESTS
jgi:hypothetical protein